MSPSTEKEATVISSRTPMEVADLQVAVERLGPGTRLANFELLECVGGGGMGRVFRARDTALARTVAIKLLSREQAADIEALLRFRNEAQTAARLNHENLVQVYHTGEENGIPFIVFEFIEGMNIRALVEKKGVLPLPEAISYTFQVAEALAHAVAQNVVHRDIKPSNILITAQGHAKLIDLGLARLQKLSEGEGDLTASGVTLGTFDYISPEQARDPRTADVRSDIYSLGCTLFFMLAGRPPFAEGTVLQKLLQHQGEEPPDLCQFRPELPVETSRVLKRMMAKDPRRRYQTAQQLIDALALLAEEVGLHPAGPGEKSWVPDQHVRIPLLQRHLPWVAPAVVLGFVVLALNFLWSPPTASTDPASPWISAAEQSSDAPPLPRTEPQSQASVTAGGGPANATDTSAARAEPTGGTSSPDRPPLTKGLTEPDLPKASPGVTAASPGPSGTKTAEGVGEAKTPETPGGSSVGGALKPELATSASPSFESSRATAVPSPSSDVLRGSAAGLKASSGVVSPVSGVPVTGPRTETGAGVLIVDPAESGANRFVTLAAACAAALTGDVIELRYNGPRQEMPLSLRNLKITIRAAEGFRPAVFFRPADMDAMMRPRAMLSLSGSQLTLVNLALILEVPREAAFDQWSLVESRPAESIRLEKCSLTIQNASGPRSAFHPDVAFFRVKAGPGTGGLISRESAVAPQGVSIALVDCVLRGEAVGLSVHDLWPVQFSWENGLLATTERLLSVEGGERTSQSGESVQIGLQHVTAVALGGLCRFVQSASGPRLLTTQVDSRNCILIGSPSASLVEHVGAARVESARQGFAWNGDRNFYEEFGGLWNIRASGASTAETMSFDAWREYWTSQRENAPGWRRVQWKQLPAADRPLSSHLPSDYALSASAASANPALGAASDGRDAGCLLDRLATLSLSTSPASASPQSSSDSAPAAPKN